MLQTPSPQGLQSITHLSTPSPGSHLPLPQAVPQSAGQTAVLSDISQSPFPQVAVVQSDLHSKMLSPGSQWPLPHSGGQSAQ
jgi:hypothetical protein